MSNKAERKRKDTAVLLSLNVKAVQVEVASSLTSDSFSQVVKRFAARGGRLQVIFSDGGSNSKETCRKPFILFEECLRI